VKEMNQQLLTNN